MLFRIGEVKLSLKESEEAARYIADSIAVFREVGTPHLESSALTLLAASERDRGQFDQALATVGESLRIAESLRSELISPESRASFLKNMQDAYHLQTELLMRLHQATPDRALNARALEVSERQRARSLLDLLTESGADLRQGVDAALISRERDISQQLSSKAQQSMRATNAARTDALKKEIGQLESELERAQAAIRKASPNYAGLTQPRPLTVGEIQNELDADTLLLEYSLGPGRSHLWAVTKTSLVSHELPAESAIEVRAREVYELLTARGAGPRGETPAARRERIARSESRLTIAARELSRVILGPVASLLGGKRLVIVADGALQYIPFAMLPDPTIGPGKPEQPLIVGREVVSLPSASALAIQRAELAGRPPAPKLLAVLADPVFDRQDTRFAKPSAEPDSPAAQLINGDNARRLEHIARPVKDSKSGVITHRLVIPRLPYTRQEADSLLALAPKTESLRALDFSANRATALNPELSQYRYVHFATHGILNSERPGLSALVLSLIDEQGKQQDGFLRANDIYNLKLPAELVVLSACQTGLGKEVRGEGLVGLTRGFMYAGAARVVVSLWSVNDRATADLMAAFYQKMLRQGERPAAALRAAQVEMWKQKQWHSPFYWAAFTLQGEWR
ncbi:MAG: CHAT domain-containing protein [Acidobacteria bacterium]|nr:CHAT domain-containing protein [Acidobacteriota bacterium]